MKWTSIIAFALVACAGVAATSASARPPLYDPVFLNIGFVCQWNARCMDLQQKAMKRALKYVRKKDPPSWKIHQCNRNAARRRERVDWIGYDHCIRNEALRYAPPPPKSPRRRSRG
jgi:hypothetical protein